MSKFYWKSPDGKSFHSTEDNIAPVVGGSAVPRDKDGNELDFDSAMAVMSQEAEMRSQGMEVDTSVFVEPEGSVTYVKASKAEFEEHMKDSMPKLKKANNGKK